MLEPKAGRRVVASDAVHGGEVQSGELLEQVFGLMAGAVTAGDRGDRDHQRQPEAILHTPGMLGDPEPVGIVDVFTEQPRSRRPATLVPVGQVGIQARRPVGRRTKVDQQLDVQRSDR